MVARTINETLMEVEHTPPVHKKVRGRRLYIRERRAQGGVHPLDCACRLQALGLQCPCRAQPSISKSLFETLPPSLPPCCQVLDVMPGVSGGVARVLIGQPFDTIKTRLQVG